MTFRSIYMDPSLVILEKAVFKISRPLLRDFGEIYHLQKTPHNIHQFINKARMRSLHHMKQELEKTNLPIYDILEFSQLPDDGFLVFPLEGVKNFTHSFPFFALGGVRFKKHKPISSLFYLPLQEECYSFSSEGVLCNRKKIQVAGRDSLEEALIGGNIGPHGTGSDLIDVLFVSSGRIDGLITNTSDIRGHIYDLYIHGGQGVSSFQNNVYKASNTLLFNKISIQINPRA